MPFLKASHNIFKVSCAHSIKHLLKSVNEGSLTYCYKPSHEKKHSDVIRHEVNSFLGRFTQSDKKAF